MKRIEGTIGKTADVRTQPSAPPEATPAALGFALLSRRRKGRWKLHGVYPSHQAAWDASAGLPADRHHVWITEATPEQVAAVAGVESNSQSDSPLSPTL